MLIFFSCQLASTQLRYCAPLALTSLDRLLPELTFAVFIELADTASVPAKLAAEAKSVCNRILFCLASPLSLPRLTLPQGLPSPWVPATSTLSAADHSADVGHRDQRSCIVPVRATNLGLVNVR
jgi:hypothetical protein